MGWKPVLHRGRSRSVALLLTALLAAPSVGLADLVVPSGRVVFRVTIREHATSKTDDIGSLKPGDKTNCHGEVD